jgi:hypothetical protein
MYLYISLPPSFTLEWKGERGRPLTEDSRDLSSRLGSSQDLCNGSFMLLASEFDIHKLAQIEWACSSISHFPLPYGTDIERTDKQTIQSIDFSNLLHVLDTLYTFYLNNYQKILIRSLDIASIGSLESVRGEHGTKTSSTGWWVFRV